MLVGSEEPGLTLAGKEEPSMTLPEKEALGMTLAGKEEPGMALAVPSCHCQVLVCRGGCGSALQDPPACMPV
jgi:hypothetical protein